MSITTAASRDDGVRSIKKFVDDDTTTAIGDELWLYSDGA